jgi:hypothetical protein
MVQEPLATLLEPSLVLIQVGLVDQFLQTEMEQQLVFLVLMFLVFLDLLQHLLLEQMEVLEVEQEDFLVMETPLPMMLAELEVLLEFLVEEMEEMVLHHQLMAAVVEALEVLEAAEELAAGTFLVVEEVDKVDLVELFG